MDRPQVPYCDANHVVVATRGEAIAIVDELCALQTDFGFATVADLCHLLDLTFTHKENQWGWRAENLRDLTKIVRTLNGLFLIQFPPSSELGRD